jgi:hypothetical protein
LAFPADCNIQTLSDNGGSSESAVCAMLAFCAMHVKADGCVTIFIFRTNQSYGFGSGATFQNSTRPGPRIAMQDSQAFAS